MMKAAQMRAELERWNTYAASHNIEDIPPGEFLISLTAAAWQIAMLLDQISYHLRQGEKRDNYRNTSTDGGGPTRRPTAGATRR